jgi:hypothetical protein
MRDGLEEPSEGRVLLADVFDELCCGPPRSGIVGCCGELGSLQVTVLNPLAVGNPPWVYA